MKSVHILRSAAKLLVVSIALLLFCGAAASSCQSNAKPKACDTRIILPAYASGSTMRAETRSECDQTPVTHSILITLEFQPLNATAWVRMGTDQCSAPPTPARGVTCLARLPGACRVGRWRTKVLVTGTTPDGEDFSFAVPEQPISHVTHCP